MKVIGKLLAEDDICYKLTTMWGDECAGSGHSIIKSTIERELRWEILYYPLKSGFKPSTGLFSIFVRLDWATSLKIAQTGGIVLKENVMLKTLAKI